MDVRPATTLPILENRLISGRPLFTEILALTNLPTVTVASVINEYKLFIVAFVIVVVDSRKTSVSGNPGRSHPLKGDGLGHSFNSVTALGGKTPSIAESDPI